MGQIVNHVWDKLLEVLTSKKKIKPDKNLRIIFFIKNKNVIFNYLENV